MFGLAKLALNAFEARELAEKVGLIPEGNWKWALRNLRDGQGNLLQGRELAEAKEGLGKLPNNARQKIQSLARMAGNNKEVGATIMQGESVPQALKGKINRNEVKPNSMVNPHMMVGDNESVDSVGHLINREGKSIDEIFGNFSGLKHDIHTHPYLSAMNKINPVKATNRAMAPMEAQFKELAQEDGHGFAPGYLEQELKTRRKRTLGANEAATAVGTKGPRLVQPSGSTYNLHNPEAYSKDNIEELFNQEKGDYRGMVLQHLYSPKGKSTIYDPLFGNESVHQVRPHGLRSVYFKNQGQY